jgi:SAM-dependent methyltransferase
MKKNIVLTAGRALARRLGLRETSESGPGVEKDANWYDRIYADAEGYRKPYYQSAYYFLWMVIGERIRRAGLRRVLEIGCGPGQLAAFLFEQGVIDTYAGLDFSPKAIEMAAARVPRGQFEIGDARTTLLHREFEHDVVVCTEVLEHIEDDFAVLGRFAPGKRCILTVPSFAHPSHVRTFSDEAAVGSRYAQFFDDLEVLRFISPNSAPGYTDLFFLVDGRRSRCQGPLRTD